MEKEEIDQKIKQMKENKFCGLCNNEKLFDGCAMQLVSITESGKIETPYETEGSGTSVMIPMCAYHMVLSQEGLLAMTTQNQVIQTKFLTQLEPKPDSELKRIILKMGRANKTSENGMIKHVAKTIISARKFQDEMIKGIKNAQREKSLEDTNERR